MSDDTIVPFRIDVPDDDVADLRRRLAATRWPDAFADPDWAYGPDLDALRELCRYWADGYDWRAHEARLNSFPQFTTTIDGANVHFLHVRSPEADATPVIMTHGWPGSVVEFVDVVEPLTDPVRFGGDARDALHLVVPAIPGYGFSGPTPGPGWHTRRIAAAWAELMTRLGYDRFGAQGGDWGATIGTWLAVDHPERVLGLHLNTVAARPGAEGRFPDVTAEERAALARVQRYAEEGAGYRAIQSTRPNTVGIGLDDSPAGLCAWILDKFWDWGDHQGDVFTTFTRDQVLTDVSIYWFTRTATSAGRLYAESARASVTTYSAPHVDVPTGVAIFPAEIATPSRRWAEERFRVVHYARHARGGHFAAYEAPDLFVADVRAFFRARREAEPGT